MKLNRLTSLLAFALAIGLVGCEKYEITTPKGQMHFANTSGASYFVLTPTTTFDVPIGVTTVADVDRTITVNITSPTGAQAGREYTVTNNPVVIPAGQALGTMKIAGDFNRYNSGRKDSLIMTLSSPDLSTSDYNNEFRLFMRGPCFDGDVSDVELRAMVGAYANSFDAGFGDYGPYTNTVKSITRINETSALAVMDNVWDGGFGDVNFIMDWSVPTNTTIRVEQPTITNGEAGVLNPAYNGMKLVIRNHSNGTIGKFSVCNGTFNLVYQLGVYNPAGGGALLGYFGNVGTTRMGR